tara:strand:+ start:405 stop:737 length:333 start_codon:yes stop_codon:yes gene_type:complete
MNHQAIYNKYPEVVRIQGQEDGSCIPYDKDGNVVEVDALIVSDETIRVEREMFFESLRNKRNRLLSETDYFALTDVTITNDMKAYRQALRDLPANTDDPANPVWPTKPGA